MNEEEYVGKPLVHIEITERIAVDRRRITNEKLKTFIETYGVNFRDAHGVDLLLLFNNMREEQIDIVFEYDIIPTHLFRFDYKRLIRLDHRYYASPYILKKFLESKYATLFLKEKVTYNEGVMGWQDMYYIDYLKAHQGRKMKHIDELLLLMENFEKKYYTLFDLLLQKINLDKNKKLCGY